jgi:hypothetical protein
MRRCLAGLIAPMALAACAYQPPAIDNPNDLPPRALGLYDAVLNGCLPFVSGEKGERDAMSAIGMFRSLELQNPFTSPGCTHHYQIRTPSPIKVGIDLPGECSRGDAVMCRVTAAGEKLEAHRRAADLAFEARFGPDFAAVPSRTYDRPQRLQFDRSFCRDGLLLNAYRDRYKDAVFYIVEVVRPARPKGIAPVCN